MKKLISLAPENGVLSEQEFDRAILGEGIQAVAIYKAISEQITPERIDQFYKNLNSWHKQSIYKGLNRRQEVFRCGYPKSPDVHGLSSYLTYMKKRGHLEEFLNRSIGCIMLKELGIGWSGSGYQKTQGAQLNRAVDSYLKKNNADSISLETFAYQKLKHYGLESDFVFLAEKMRHAAEIAPDPLKERVLRRVSKLVSGIVFHALSDQDLEDPKTKEIAINRLRESLHAGYYFAITYPFVDDLLDDPTLLSEPEKQQFTDAIKTAIKTGTTPEFSEELMGRDNLDLVFNELKEGFLYISEKLPVNKYPDTYKRFYSFINAQAEDRNPGLEEGSRYSFLIQKAALSRIVARDISGSELTDRFVQVMRPLGLMHQLCDCLNDIDDDLQNKVPTPFTEYYLSRNSDTEKQNPFTLLISTQDYLSDTVFSKDDTIGTVLKDWFVLTLTGLKEKVGDDRFNELLECFVPDQNQKDRLKHIVSREILITHLDHLLWDQVEAGSNKKQASMIALQKEIKKRAGKLNKELPLSSPMVTVGNDVLNAANYSLKAGGKRIRPVLAEIMAVDGYGLDRKTVLPLMKGIEYLHTASLIFDDLPAEDNAEKRRNQPTCHVQFMEYTAQLAGIYLINAAVSAMAGADISEDKKAKIIKYAADMTQEMAMGQEFDLESVGKPLTLEQLETLSDLKTGKAFEGSLVMAAMLADAPEDQIEYLKAFARHMGIVFQIKDDILDVEGDPSLTGKDSGMDEKNNCATFVSVLGLDQAKVKMYDHYWKAAEALNHISVNTQLLRSVLDYLLVRKK